MRKIIFNAVIIIQLLLCSQQMTAKTCSVGLYIGNIPVVTPLDTLFNAVDSIYLPFNVQPVTPGFCFCYPPSVTWYYNSGTSSALSFTITDTGNYFVNYYVVSNGCLDGSGYFYIYVHYRVATSTSEANHATNLTVYPSLSSGIFNIKSADKNLTKLDITNGAGRIVLSSSNNFSEIDLTNFPSGIYFYAITDEKENVFRGRIVKE